MPISLTCLPADMLPSSSFTSKIYKMRRPSESAWTKPLTIKRLLKTFLFGCWVRGALWLTVKAVPHKFSYLLTYLRQCDEYTICPLRCTALDWLAVHLYVCRLYRTENGDGLCCRLLTPCPKEAELVPFKNLEVPRHSIQLVKKLGAGQFGEVWSGQCQCSISYWLASCKL